MVEAAAEPPAVVVVDLAVVVVELAVVVVLAWVVVVDCEVVVDCDVAEDCEVVVVLTEAEVEEDEEPPVEAEVDGFPALVAPVPPAWAIDVEEPARAPAARVVVAPALEVVLLAGPAE